MPYLLLTLGLALGAYALYRFFSQATAQQAANAVRAIFIVLMLGVCFFLALTGRVAPAMAIAAALIPLVFRGKDKGLEQNNTQEGKPTSDVTISSTQEALKILGLENTQSPSKEEIEAAYKTLMKKLHPDQGGNDYFAQKLNEARNFLLKLHD